MLEIVLGPARSDKSALGVARFCEKEGPHRQSQAMWLVPHRSLARTLRLRVAEKNGALSELKILTLDDLSRWVFQEAHPGTSILTDFSRFLLLSQLSDKAIKKKARFVPTLAKAIDELKEHLLWPKGAPPHLAQEYNQLLEAHQAVDRKSMMARAIQTLSQKKSFFQTENIKEVLFYGFTSFSPLEWKLVEVILNQVPGWISLTGVKNQPTLFSETLQTLKRLQSSVKSCQVKEIPGTPTVPQRRLIETSNYDSELEWMAQECARLVQEEGIPPHEIAIVSGAGGGMAKWVRQLFRRYGLIVQSFSPEPALSNPLIQHCWALLEKGWEPGKLSADFILKRLKEEGVFTKLMESPPEEAQHHFAFFHQWINALQEAEGQKVGLQALQEISFSPPPLKVPALHFYGAEAPPLESYRVLFLSHVLENSFPRPLKMNLFSSNPFVSEEKHRSQERLAFYQMVTRASEKLYLLFSQKDAQDKEQLPSLYLRKWDSIFPEMPLPQPEKIGFLTPYMDQTDPASVLPEMQTFFLRKKHFEDPLLLQDIHARLLKSASITQFETFGKCQYLHLANNLMRLQEEQVDQWARVRGELAHSILATLGPSIGSQESEELIATMGAVTDREFEKLVFPIPEGKRELEKRRLKSMLSTFLRHEKERLKETETEPIFFEKAFGQDGEEAYHLNVSNGTTLSLRGRIDRIDRSLDGERVTVIDYKSGALPAPKGMKEGTNLQIACYLDVCEKVFQLNPTEGFYFSLKDRKRSGIKQKQLREKLNEMREHLGHHAEQILKGAKRAKSDLETCQKCSYRFACRTQEEVL